MRQWKVVALMLVLGLSVSSVAQEQSNDDLRREVEQLKQQFAKVAEQAAQTARENAELRGRMDQVQTGDESLEQRINALADNLDYAAGTTVKSVANPIEFTGEFRARWGITTDRDFGRDTVPGQNGDEDDEGSFTDARFRVATEYTFDRDVVTHFSMQANGLYDNGNTPAGDSGLSDIELYEGWILIQNIFGRKELTSKTGRQEIVLGNEFQFGNNDFFSGETFDGTHWMWSSENFDLHALYVTMNASESLNTRDWPYASSGEGYDDDDLYSLYFTLKSISKLTLDLYWIYFNGHNGGSFGTLGNGLGTISEGDSVKKDLGGTFYYHTFGLRLDGMFDVAAGLDYNLEFAYQTGSVNNEPTAGDIDVDGFALEVEIGLTFDATNKFRLFVRFLWAEGADRDDAGNFDDTGYIPLFPERHSQATNAGGNNDRRARYGLLDIIPMDNIITPQIGLTFDPATDWTLGLTALYAIHDEDVATPTGDDDSIGFEIDVFAEYRYSAQTTMSAGIAAFFADDAAPLKNSGFAGDDDDVTVLFYLQTRVVF